MALDKVILELLCIMLLDSLVIGHEYERDGDLRRDIVSNEIDRENDDRLTHVFNGVYAECFLNFSYSCLQKKTLLYLRELDKLSEVSVIGDYVKFVKVNISGNYINRTMDEYMDENNSEELSVLIDKAVDVFFDNHVIKFSALGRNISIPNTEEGFMGRKKRKGGGGGGGHEFDGKKKMMMMAMMCMKMKFMMMVPAMMGMMGIMSFKGMIFSMMTFMLSKMILLMKLLEKKGGLGGGGGGGGDGGWAASSGGGGSGAWMPAGGQDFGGGGYDANGQWQSRSIIDFNKDLENMNSENIPIISYVVPTVRYSNNSPNKNARIITKQLEDELVKDTSKLKSRKKRSEDNLFHKFDQHYNEKPKSRKKRSIIDILQNAYLYWMNQILGSSNRRKSNFPRYKIANGIKYVYYPRNTQKIKIPHPQIINNVKNNEESFRPIILAEDFNKGEIIDSPIENRMNRKKFHKMKTSMNDAVDENPWE